jgi:hypothetical protein
MTQKYGCIFWFGYTYKTHEEMFFLTTTTLPNFGVHTRAGMANSNEYVNFGCQLFDGQHLATLLWAVTSCNKPPTEWLMNFVMVECRGRSLPS